MTVLLRFNIHRLIHYDFDFTHVTTHQVFAKEYSILEANLGFITVLRYDSLMFSIVLLNTELRFISLKKFFRNRSLPLF